jgi:hypothetical protein
MTVQSFDVPLPPEELKRRAERDEHFMKVLRNFVALSNQVQEFMQDPRSGEIPEEAKIAMHRITEGGMWFRMSMDLERAAQIAGAKLVVKPKGEEPHGRDGRSIQ